MIAQGQTAELAGAGGRHELIVGVDDQERALALLRGDDHVSEARRSGDGLRVALAGGPDGAAAVNALLVGAGLAVFRLEPIRQTLELRFLEVTSKLGEGGDGGAGGGV